MPMSSSTSSGSIATGTLQLILTALATILGVIVVTKSTLKTEHVATTSGLWSLFFLFPGILTIAAGRSKNSEVMGCALFLNILGILGSLSAAGVCLRFSIALKDAKPHVNVHGIAGCLPSMTTVNGKFVERCICGHANFQSGDIGVNTFYFKCDDLNLVYYLMIALAVVFGILAIISFTASIYGCMGTCCAPAQSVVIVTPNMPTHSANTVVVTSNQNNMATFPPTSYASPFPNQMPPPAYNHEQYGDTRPLTKNMAI